MYLPSVIAQNDDAGTFSFYCFRKKILYIFLKEVSFIQNVFLKNYN